MTEELLANVRDASWLRNPRHDGPGGHRTGAWGPKFHVSIDHPRLGESWSACGTAFLIDGGEELKDIPLYQRCQRRGCKERWPSPEVGSDA